jgi:hypothetical protein
LTKVQGTLKEKGDLMEKLDLRKEYKHLYRPRHNKVTVVDVPALKFALIDGAIEQDKSPGTSPAFQAATEALYGISYTIKFMSKKREVNPIDYPVMALEALWWIEDGEFDITDPSNWLWTAMIMQPEHITDEMFAAGLSETRKKKNNPALSRVRFETFHEGLAMQIMHIGPYSEEPATLEKMDAFARENGYGYRGKHHEIYLGDPRRTKPENLKTVLRHPVEKASS